VNKDITIKDTIKDLELVSAEHKEMLEMINKNLPKIEKSSKNFGKSQSQFMDSMLTVSHPTPLRNVRQILAEIEKSMLALKEAYFKNKLEEVEIKKLQRDIEKEKDELELEKKEIELMQKQLQLEDNKKYISGAIRKVTNYTEQYNSILKSIGKEEFTEKDFEEEEEKYHIMKAFDQGLNAARSHNGVIDEGNHIYFSQIGVNGTSAQREMRKYLESEGKLIAEGKEPTMEMQLKFLNDMADKFKGSAITLIEHKGMKLRSDVALLK